jgi:hypothetical protein
MSHLSKTYTHYCNLLNQAFNFPRAQDDAGIRLEQGAKEKFLAICEKDNAMDQLKTWEAQRGCLVCCLQTRDQGHHSSKSHRRIQKCVQIKRLWQTIEPRLDGASNERQELYLALSKLRNMLKGEGARLLNLADWPKSFDDAGHGGDSALVYFGARLWFDSWAEDVVTLCPSQLQGSEEAALFAEIKQTVHDLWNAVMFVCHLCRQPKIPTALSPQQSLDVNYQVGECSHTPPLLGHNRCHLAASSRVGHFAVLCAIM